MIAAYTRDLMDRSKIQSAAPDVKFVAQPEALVGLAGVEVVIVDLAQRGVMEVLPRLTASGVRVVAYGSHVDTAMLDAARAAGCAEVLPRSKFFRDIAGLLAG